MLSDWMYLLLVHSFGGFVLVLLGTEQPRFTDYIVGFGFPAILR